VKDIIEKFLLKELQGLALDRDVSEFQNLEDEICRLLLSKKFRKYSASSELIEHIRKSVANRVANGKPIHVTFWQGGFKLWRLEEAPEVDWSELFALMYYVTWLKPVLGIYKPGVVIEFYLDDIIMERLCNYTREEILAYHRSLQAVIDFLCKYIPLNLKFVITTASSRFHDEATFWKELDSAIAIFKPASDMVLSPDQIATVELNYRRVKGERLGKLWREENRRIHDAYGEAVDIKLVNEAGLDGKILAVPYHKDFDIGLNLGSTKNSIVKYWIGVGALEPRGETFMATVLSPSQLCRAKYDVININVSGLGGKNFKKIRVLRL